MSYSSGTDAKPETCDLLCLDLPNAEVLRRSLPAPDELETLGVGLQVAHGPDSPRGRAGALGR